MPNLSLMEAEAQRLVGRLTESRRRSLQEALIALCKNHWLEEVRGPQPETPLARTLWSVAPPLVDLFVDLYAVGDGRLDALLQGHKPAYGLALLLLAEIENGNAEGAHITLDPMMAFESPPIPMHYVQRISALLRGNLETPILHHHTKRPRLWKALVTISAHIGRCDSPVVLRVIDLLASTHEVVQEQDGTLEQLREDLHKLGVRFLCVNSDHIQLEIHGHEHKSVRKRHVEEMLFEIRQVWLG